MALTSATSIWLNQIRNGTAADSIKQRWTDIVVPSMKSQFWYPTQDVIAYTISDTVTTYEQEYIDSGMRIQDSNFYQEY